MNRNVRIFQLPSCSRITVGNNNGFFSSPDYFEHFEVFMAMASMVTSMLLSYALIISVP